MNAHCVRRGSKYGQSFTKSWSLSVVSSVVHRTKGCAISRMLTNLAILELHFVRSQRLLNLRLSRLIAVLWVKQWISRIVGLRNRRTISVHWGVRWLVPLYAGVDVRHKTHILTCLAILKLHFVRSQQWPSLGWSRDRISRVGGRLNGKTISVYYGVRKVVLLCIGFAGRQNRQAGLMTLRRCRLLGDVLLDRCVRAASLLNTSALIMTYYCTWTYSVSR